MLNKILDWIRYVLFLALYAGLLLTRSTLPPADTIERVRAFTRDMEFDYAAWMLDAFALKVSDSSVGAARYMDDSYHHDLTLEYIRLVGRIQQLEGQLNEIYANPDIEDPQAASADIRAELDTLFDVREFIAPIAESIIQGQVASVVAEMNLTLAGQPVPPVMYHSTPLPLALIVSPREAIRQDADISLLPGLTVDERSALEDQVDESLNVSSLVVPIGGVGIYPTMVMQTTDVNWLAEVVAHEWIHNYLTLRPLGMSYLNTPELRIMNETAASIAGKEIGLVVIERYYPELVPPPPPPVSEEAQPAPQEPAAPPAFSFNNEMQITRVEVDRLLAEGKIEEAEEYMEQRRVFFYEHGYLIRKLNQAFFAFYGAYADAPTGAAGADPVGAAVRALRAQSDDLAEFINRIAWMSSFDELQQAVPDVSSVKP